MNPRIAVLGLGSPFRGDDAAGPEVVRRLHTRNPQADVEWVEAGPAGNLLLDFLDYDRLVVVDCARMGTSPGTVQVFYPEDVHPKPTAEIALSPHEADPLALWRLGKSLGFRANLTLVGIEPLSLEEGAEISPPVQKGLSRAVEAVEKILECWIGKKVEDGAHGAAYTHR